MSIATLPITYSDGNVLSASDLTQNFAAINNATVPVASGGTGLTAGTSGGVLYYSATGTLASSGALTASAIVLGGGAGAAPTTLAGTSGGVVYFSAANTAASSGALTANGAVLGGGAGAAPTATAAGSANQVLRVPNAGGAPVFSTLTTGFRTFEFVRKTGDDTIQSDATLNNDDELFVALAANEVVQFECGIHWNSGSTPDIQFAFTVPAAGATRYGHVGAFLDSGGSASQALDRTSGQAITLGGSTNDHFAVVSGVAVNGANAGNLQFQWAQGTSDASNTTVYTNSYLKVWRV